MLVSPSQPSAKGCKNVWIQRRRSATGERPGDKAEERKGYAAQAEKKRVMRHK
jgi:hypothetical protein